MNYFLDFSVNCHKNRVDIVYIKVYNESIVEIYYMTKGVLKMSDIKKKILAVAVICTLSLSMAACSDKKSGSNEAGIKTATISSEEAKQLMKHESGNFRIC